MFAVPLLFAKEHPNFRLNKTTARPAPDFKAHNIGNLWNVVTNYGSFGDPNFETTGRPSMEWPAGSNSSYLYDGAIWVLTTIDGEKHNSSYFYATEEWEPSEGYDFLVGNDEVATYKEPKSIFDTWASFDDFDEKPDHFPLGIRIERHGLSWSMPEYDDLIAYEFYIINEGLNGDLNDTYVSFWYDLDVASIDATDKHIDDLVDFDGWDGPNSNTDEIDWVDPFDLDADSETGYDDFGLPYGDPRNVESSSETVGYLPEKVEPDGIFDEYTLIIDPKGPPVFADVDVTIGSYEIAAGDSLRRKIGEEYFVVYGYKVPRGVSYIYDGDNPTSSDNDMGERTLLPTATGYAGGRAIYADPTSADYYFPNPDSLHYRMVRPFSHQWWNWESDPDNDAECFDYVVGQHEFSQGYKFLPNPLDVGAPTFDYRYLYSVGPYDIPEGDTVKVVWIEAVGEGLQGMRETMDKALEAYYTGSKWSSPYNPSDQDSDIHWRLPAPPATPNFSYSASNQTVKLVWDNIAEITPDTKTGEIDFAGYKVYRSRFSPSNWELIHAMYDVSKFDTDFITVRNTDGDSLGVVSIDNQNIGIGHSFLDEGGVTPWGTEIAPPINGLPYFYALVGFDTGNPLIDLPAAESGKTNYNKNDAGAPVPVYPKVVYEDNPVFDIDNIKVVPNPYKATGPFEAQYESKINFINLPPAAKITVFSMAGDMIIEIQHVNGTDLESWDLLSRNNQAIVSGLYLYVVETVDDKYIGKFVVLR